MRRSASQSVHPAARQSRAGCRFFTKGYITPIFLLKEDLGDLYSRGYVGDVLGYWKREGKLLFREFREAFIAPHITLNGSFHFFQYPYITPI